MGSTADEELCLRWNDFESILSRSFSEMRSESDFFDVRIACFDKSSSMKTVPAHKVVLSACSPVFKEILRNLDYSGNKGPLIFLRGIQYKEVEAVLDFMYNGQTKVQHTELDSFLAAAEELKIKGLTTSNNSSGPSAGAPSSSRKRNFHLDDDMGDMEGPKTSKGFGKRSRPSAGNSSTVEDVHIKSERIMVDEEGADESCGEFPEEGGDGTMYDETAYDDDGNPGGEFPPDSKVGRQVASRRALKNKMMVLRWCDTIDWATELVRADEIVKAIVDSATFDLPNFKESECRKHFIHFISDTYCRMFASEFGWTMETLKLKMWPGMQEISIIMSKFESLAPGLSRQLTPNGAILSPLLKQLDHKFEYVRKYHRERLYKSAHLINHPDAASLKKQERPDEKSQPEPDMSEQERIGQFNHATNWQPSMTDAEEEEMTQILETFTNDNKDEVFARTRVLQRWKVHDMPVGEQLAMFPWLRDPAYQMQLFAWMMSEKFANESPVDYLMGKIDSFLNVVFPYFRSKRLEAGSDCGDVPADGRAGSKLIWCLLELEKMWPSGAIIQAEDAIASDADILDMEELTTLPTLIITGQNKKTLLVVIGKTIVARLPEDSAIEAHILVVNGFYTFAFSYESTGYSVKAKNFWRFVMEYLWDLTPKASKRRGRKSKVVKSSVCPAVQGLWFVMQKAGSVFTIMEEEDMSSEAC